MDKALVSNSISLDINIDLNLRQNGVSDEQWDCEEIFTQKGEESLSKVSKIVYDVKKVGRHAKSSGLNGQGVLPPRQRMIRGTAVVRFLSPTANCFLCFLPVRLLER
jgi:hypothetical protein